MISPKQKKILAFPYSTYDAIICDGAVRSGKTSIMTVAFIDWAMRNFSSQRFGICGKTVGSATENIIKPYMAMSYAKERYIIQWRRSDKIMEIQHGPVKNWFEVFGGKDESSYMLIQGRTLAGVLLDEVVLMPESFVNQALARCSVNGAKLWFSCNPDNPNHWFYENWIKRNKERNTIYLRFSMRDNPGLSKETMERYEAMYDGVFYQRYIEGKWVVAKGLVYPMFYHNRHILHADPETTGHYYVSSDFGIQNATVFHLWRREKESDRWICIREYYYSGRDENRQKTVAELVDGLVDMLDGVEVKQVIIDPSAAALKVELRKRGFHTRDADNDVLNGISDVCSLLGHDKIAFTDRCEMTIKEFGCYLWDNKAAEKGIDAPIKENDHGMDSVRYFARTMRLAKKDGKKKIIPVWRYRDYETVG